VVFRLTRDEYHRLQKACSATGARSLSDYTRRELLARPPGDRGRRGEVTLSQVDQKLEDLHAAVRQSSRR
jgi:hypothetical protein